ncbi:tautomerase family protein [Campylobacter suis]|uniref:Tautomerase n=1 Tax=Campylobacter suis TaxID=2790657 RepID=A0ABM8Q6L7_9BACT|nr:4-oxalocrotonate tautomerase family protein [Campylobacter suis]CAD7288454.1 putative tautomerase [Campylobacter suis]
MPYINIRVTKENGEPTQEQKEQLASGVTELFERVLGRSGKNAVVIIDEINPDDYAIGGKSVAKIRTKTLKKD